MAVILRLVTEVAFSNTLLCACRHPTTPIR